MTTLGAQNRQDVVVIRHGETEWSLSGRHTGLTDVGLTERGRDVAKRLGSVLSKADFSIVLSSPLQRARATCELAGFGGRMVIDPDIVEWNYGEYEGLLPQEIDERAPGWMIFTDGCPGGECPTEVGARVDRVIARIRSGAGRVALFAHGHFLRVLAARWIGLSPAHGKHFRLDTSTLSILGYYRDIPAVKSWNVPIANGR